MSEQSDKIKDTWRKKGIALGQTAASLLMSSLYPVDFEAYMIAFELCDSKGKTLDYFTFPIMPSELSIEETLPTRVENTFGGVNALSSNVYVPKKISLRGNFGRQFRLLMRNSIDFPIFQKGGPIQERDYGEGGKQLQTKEVLHNLKTGFGCFKVLQSIINRSVEVDQYGNCNKLYMYNLAYGENYLVKAKSFRGSQNLGLNGIWSYDLSLESICPLHLEEKGAKKYAKAFGMVAAQSALNLVTSGAKETLNMN